MGDVPKGSNKTILSRDVAIKRLVKAQKNVAHRNPFAPYSDIFEEPTERDRYLGDPIFWKNYEYIDLTRVAQPGTIEFKNLKLMFFETISYMLVLTIVTLFAYTMHNPQMQTFRRQQEMYWGQCDRGGSCNLNTVTDHHTFWKWMHDDFSELSFTPRADYTLPIAKLNTTFSDNQFHIAWSPRYIGSETNVLLGTIRVRQVRVQKNRGCSTSALYKQIFTNCYGDFMPLSESRENFLKLWSPTYTKRFYEWNPPEVTLAIPVKGNETTYTAGGYFWDLPLELTSTLELINDLKSWHWVDAQTRAVIIEFNILNTNINVVVNNRIGFEFTPSGQVKPFHKMQTWSLYMLSFGVRGDLLVFIFFILYLMVFLITISYIIWQIVRLGTRYFNFGWNLVDLLLFGINLWYIIIRAMLWTNVANEPGLLYDRFGARQLGHPQVFHSFSKVGLDLASLAPKVLSVIILVMWMRILKYLCLVGWFRLLLRVLERSAKELLIFSVLVVVLFTGFAVTFFVAFGDEQEVFASLDSSILVLYFFLLSGISVDYAEWFAPSSSGGSLRPILFLFYFFLVYFISFSIFMAIVLDAYTMVNIFHRNKGENTDNPMRVFLWAYYKHSGDAIDDWRLNPEDRSIKLSLLPGMVSKKWVEKKKRLREMVDKNANMMEVGPDGEPQKMSWLSQISNALLPASAIAAKRAGQLPAKVVRTKDLYALEDMADDEISRLQLQRLLNEDLSLRLLLNTDKSLEVIRRFKKESTLRNDNNSNAIMLPNYNPAVNSLQDKVFKKLDQLEKSGLEMEARDVPQVRVLSNLLDKQYGDMQKEWRSSLTGVLEFASMLSEGLIELTQGLDRVQENHQMMLETLDEPSETTSSGGSMSSSMF